MSSLATVELYSAALERQVSYSILLPEAGAPPFAVLYLLHGYSDDHRAWIERANLQRHAAALPLAVVLPSGENSYWVDLGPGRRFEQFVVEDLPAHVQRHFAVRAGRAAIGGLSMGGYGAIRLGLKYPERYASIFAHSSRLPSRAELPSLPWTRGLAAAALDELDVAALAARLDPARMPRLSFDCGRDDHLLDDNRRFHAQLERRGIAHHYAEHPGAHTWDYWDEHVRDALAQHAEVLGRG